MLASHGERQGIGFKWEDRLKNMLESRGHSVEMPTFRNNKGYDLIVDGKHKVDVKATVWTTYSGSDGYPISGWVFSNMHNPPTCDFYILVCLKPNREEIEKIYIIPSNKVLQRTLTVTVRDKHKEWLDNWGAFEKKASLIPIFFKLHKRNTFKKEENKKQLEYSEMVYGLVGAGLAAVVSNGDWRYIGLGSVAGRYIGKNLL